MILTRQSLLSPRAVAILVVVAIAIGTAACSHLVSMHSGDVQRPAATEFGFGPRPSAQQVFTATLQPAQPLRLRHLQSMTVQIADATGKPIDNAVISIAGGMPEHSHGFPTQPRVQRALGGGVYEIAGVRFSMGGWWELKLTIDSPAGKDSVTFNLDL